MILYCSSCGHIWKYQGEKAGVEPGTSCPHCKGYVKFKANRVDQPLPDGADYGGAEYLGVTQDDCPVYYDREYGVAVNFIGAPDPYTECREEKVEHLLQYMKDVAWQLGWKYQISEEQVKELQRLD